MRTIWIILMVMWSGAAAAQGEDPELAGSLEAEIDGKKVVLPSLKLDVQADVAGDLATVTVTQTFVNPFDKPMHATYLFPLNESAAVYEMVMEVGSERVRAVIKKREDAVKTFAAAKAEGKAASLLQEHRPNMFTQDVANLMPGKPIKVELKYVHAVRKVDGAYELVIPLVVGPRYQPMGANKGLSKLPSYPSVSGIDIPDTVEKDRVSIDVRLSSGTPISDVSSRTHKIGLVAKAKNRIDVGLLGGRVIDNRDFVLRYSLSGERASAGLLAHRDGRGGFFSLLIEPPTAPRDAEIGAREMVFVLDCSGSMSGQPLDASKAFMREAMRRLRPRDSFRIIRFSDSATEFSSSPLRATPENIRLGLAHTEGLESEGGTEMSSGIVQALDAPVAPGSMRIVTFLTDGYIGNEHEILSLIKRKIGDARLFSFGVGSSVNRYLLEEMGEMGRGFTRYFDPTESLDAVAQELAARLDAPVLTDIEIDWGGLDPDSIAPARIPDLFAGNAVRIQGRYDRPGTYTVRVTGRIAGKKATLPIEVTFPETIESGAPSTEGVALMWARSTISSDMGELSTPLEWRDPKRSDADIQAAVTKLGLSFSLVTKWTSFVAVSEEIVNAAPQDAVQTEVPLNPPAGVSEMAFGDKGFGGSSTPEPGVTISMLLMALAGIAIAAKRQRKEQTHV